MRKIACIPAFNEEGKIGGVVRKTLPYVDKVIVLDDGSTDDTFNEAKDAGAEVIKHKKNMGKGAALKSLFQYARESQADIMITLDGDGQFLADEIPNLLQPIRMENADIVIGYRFENADEMPGYRKIGNKVLDKMTNLASELPFRDTQSGFRSYSKKAIESITFKSDGFGADSEILINASKKELDIREKNVTVIYNIEGDTSTKNPVSHSIGVVSSLLELIALKRPLSYIGIPGIILTVLGLIFFIIVISYFNETRYFSIPFTLLALGSFIIGIILLMVSIILFSININSKNS